jgi:group I intron endonuclease
MSKKYYGIIYKVTNKINGKIYIGLTTRTLKDRKKDHIRKAKYEKGFYFHNAIRKYGEENFIWKQIDKSTCKSKLSKLEIFYIGKYNSSNRKFGYNSTLGGEGGKWTE